MRADTPTPRGVTPTRDADARVRVLLLVDTLGMGGAEQLVVSLAERLDRERFDVCVLALSARDGNVLLDRLLARGHDAASLGSRSRYDLRAVVALKHYVRRRRIDVIHTHLTEAGIVGRIAGAVTGTPVVSTLHNVADAAATQRWDRRLLERWTARHLTDRLVAVSDTVRDGFAAAWNPRPERLRVIRNAVAAARFLRIHLDRPAVEPRARFWIATIGRLHPQKGHTHLLGALRLVADESWDVGLRIVGSGELEPRLRRQTADLGLEDRVEFLGRRDDVPEILADSHAVVMASLWEGLPLSGIEAMAAGRPVVLTDVGGNAELVEHGTHGLLVPPGDERALADAIIALAGDDALRARLGAAARRRILTHHSVDALVAEHERLYLETARGRGRPAGTRRRQGRR